jgi:hypothetical protein
MALFWGDMGEGELWSSQRQLFLEGVHSASLR